MVLTPAVIVPDQSSWTLWGLDLGGLGFTPAATPEQARAMLLPEPVPFPLAEAVRAAWQRMPAPRRIVSYPRQLPGIPAGQLLEDGWPRHEHGHDATDDDASGHMDHDHDMMAIVGDPSADGLVMDSTSFELGPLAAGLPGGLVLDLSLDGDIVEHCRARASLTMPLGPIAGGAHGDPTASAAWGAAIAEASERAAGNQASEASARTRIAAVEGERALSHLSWLRAFGWVLGWAELAERADAAVRALTPRAEGPEGLQAARRQAQRVCRLLEGSRRLGSRTRGRARTPKHAFTATAAGGPVARAAGVVGDARSGDPLYEGLGFRETTLTAGDAEARALLRTTEAAGAIDLAIAALREPGSPSPSPHDGSLEARVEGPRGPVRAASVDGRLAVAAPGGSDLLDLAGEAVVELEIGAAVVGIASFDLSGWKASE